MKDSEGIKLEHDAYIDEKGKQAWKECPEFEPMVHIGSL